MRCGALTKRRHSGEVKIEPCRTESGLNRSRMHRILVCIVLLCLNGFAQTNCQPAATLFSSPSLELRLNPVESSKLNGEMETVQSSKELLGATHGDNSAFAEPSDAALFNRKQTSLKISSQGSGDLTTDNFRSDVARAIYQRLDRDGVFNRPPVIYENGLDRFIDRTFSPEVFKVGKMEISCSLLTAIKRKNPLCLANPMFFNISW